jgi:hypothetical protein
MKVFLDDVRDSPEGWLRTYSVEGTIELLESGFVTELSLDHDLGTEETGYDVVKWIEEKVATEGFVAPEIRIHSANPVGRKRMEQGIESIRKLSEK